MNLNTVTTVLRPESAHDIAEWRDGYAWLAGGTWLFSEPQLATDTLIDLEGLDWRALEIAPDGLEIASTCRIAELYRFDAPREWAAASLFGACCNALLASFKIWRSGTWPRSAGISVCLCLPGR